MSWTQGQVLTLLREYKRHPCLYSLRNEYNQSQDAKKAALEYVRLKMTSVKPGINNTEIKQKFENLHTTFLGQYIKHKASLVTARRPDEVYRPTLFYYNEMAFLIGHFEPRGATDLMNTLGPVKPESLNDTVTDELDERPGTQVTKTEKEPEPTFVVPRPSKMRKQATKRAPIRKRKSNTLTRTALNNLAKTLQSSDKDTVLANFFITRLRDITRPEVRLDVEERITQILYEGSRQCQL